jgi:sugar transferase EpsL
VGRHGAGFTLHKFRTMTSQADANGRLLSDEVRLTRFGKFLRATSLDELPSVFNVLRGEMSLVGPRPLLVEYLALYSVEQFRRHEVVPGITGLAQVSGRNQVSWERRFELDVWYVDNVSFKLDMQILLKTLLVVLRRRGVSAANHATMPPFSRSSESR